MADISVSGLCETVRRRFNLPEGDEIRFQPLVEPALRALSYDVARDPQLRNWLMTNPATTTAVLDADGVADLTTLITSPRILLECLSYGEIRPPVNVNYSTQPFRMIDNAGAGELAGAYDSLIYKCWLDGVKLHTKSGDSNVIPLVGTISFLVPYHPTLTQLPNSLVQRLVWGPYWSDTPITEAKGAQT